MEAQRWVNGCGERQVPCDEETTSHKSHKRSDRWCSGADGSAIIYTASFSKETSPPSRDRPPRGALDFMGIYEPQPAEIDSPASRNHGQPMLVMPEGFSPFANTRTSGRKKKLANIVVPYRVTDEKQ